MELSLKHAVWPLMRLLSLVVLPLQFHFAQLRAQGQLRQRVDILDGARKTRRGERWRPYPSPP